MFIDYSVADGENEFVADPEPEVAAPEVNLVLTEDLNQRSVEPKAAPEGKHRSMTH